MTAKKHRAKRPFSGALETPGELLQMSAVEGGFTSLCLTSPPSTDSVFQDWKIMSGFMAWQGMDACAPTPVTA